MDDLKIYSSRRVLVAGLAVFVLAIAMLSLSSSAHAAKLPSLTFSPQNPTIGQRVTVKGKNFKKKRKYTIIINDVKYKTHKTSKTGRLKFSFKVPKNAYQTFFIAVKCAGQIGIAEIFVAEGKPKEETDLGIGYDPEVGAPPTDPEDPDYDPDWEF